ncbi:MAG: riboflavin biosynthesis protein RibF [Clostridia bacterium]|nr:riboflavin biosynthesis protein RibF [Clostridia bacterium]
MDRIAYGKKYPFGAVVALGYFDCLHKGHREIISAAKKIAAALGAKTLMFTFDDDASGFYGKVGGSVYTLSERISAAESLGVDGVISATFDEEFRSTTAEDFIEKLLRVYEIKGFVCGFDYTFGRGGAGDAKTLRRICSDKGVLLEVVDEITSGGEKISTTAIKKHLSEGNVAAANELLGDRYFIEGKVVRDRGVGRTLGFPTANVNIPPEKFRIKSGVYKTHTVIDGKEYASVTNYGSRPTFELLETLAETYIDGFDGDIYGKTIRVYFEGYIRPVIKFDTVDELIERLNKDKETIANDKIRTERKQ